MKQKTKKKRSRISKNEQSTVQPAPQDSLQTSSLLEEASNAAQTATTEQKQLNSRRKAFVIATLRRASYRWPERTKALKAGRVDRGMYKCAVCGSIKHLKEVQLDHISPVVPLKGWDSWDGYVERMLCEASGFQVICKKPCHETKTLLEKEIRKQFRKK